MGAVAPARRLLPAALVASILALTACGTRLPRSAFAGDPSLGSALAPQTTVAGSGSANPSSDAGVTPTEVRVGLIVSLTSPLGAEAFSAPMYGAQAFFRSLNARGGVHGRTVRLIVCDDGATGTGNLDCAHKLIDSDKVFAFAGNSIFNYAAASYVSAKDVPDIGGEPVGTAYDQYQHLYAISGSSSPRDGRTVGVNGKLAGGAEVFHYFKVQLGSRIAGVVSYNQSDSQRYADLTAAGLRLEGYQVVREQVDFAVPNFDAAAVDMKAHHVDTVFDALDGTGNVSLCKSMTAAHLTLKAKVGTVQGWSDTVRTDFASTPACRYSLYATAGDRNYMDTRFPAVAQFRSDIRAAFPDREDKLSMWEEEGWASGHWLADATASCGANLTRACVESFVNGPAPYTAGGILQGSSFTVNTNLTGIVHNCLNVGQWQDAANDGRGGWVTRTPGGDFICYDVPQVVYSP